VRGVFGGVRMVKEWRTPPHSMAASSSAQGPGNVYILVKVVVKEQTSSLGQMFWALAANRSALEKSLLSRAWREMAMHFAAVSLSSSDMLLPLLTCSLPV